MKMDSRDIEKVYQLLESGQKVIAIKEIREMTGLGLKEAKRIADNYQIFLETEEIKCKLICLFSSTTMNESMI